MDTNFKNILNFRKLSRKIFQLKKLKQKQTKIIVKKINNTTMNHFNKI